MSAIIKKRMQNGYPTIVVFGNKGTNHARQVRCVVYSDDCLNFNMSAPQGARPALPIIGTRHDGAVATARSPALFGGTSRFSVPACTPSAEQVGPAAGHRPGRRSSKRRPGPKNGLFCQTKKQGARSLLGRSHNLDTASRVFTTSDKVVHFAIH